MRLLLIVDCQNGFVSDCTRHVLDRIVQLLKGNLYNHVAFTRFLNYPDSPWIRNLQWHRLMDGNETALAPELSTWAEVVFNKNTYTAVNDSFLQFLKDRQINQVDIAGIDTDCCVLKTAVDLFEAGVKPRVLAHYCASNGGEVSHQAALTVLSRLIGARAIETEAIDDSTVPRELTSVTPLI